MVSFFGVKSSRFIGPTGFSPKTTGASDRAVLVPVSSLLREYLPKDFFVWRRVPVTPPWRGCLQCVAPCTRTIKLQIKPDHKCVDSAPNVQSYSWQQVSVQTSQHNNPGLYIHILLNIIKDRWVIVTLSSSAGWCHQHVFIWLLPPFSRACGPTAHNILWEGVGTRHMWQMTREAKTPREQRDSKLNHRVQSVLFLK